MEYNKRHSLLNSFLIFIIAICLFSFLMISCRSSRIEYIEIPAKDSIRVEVKEKVITVHDTTFIEIPAQKEQQTTRDSSSHLETDFAISDARINTDGSLSHSLENKAQKEIPYEKEIVYVNKDSIVFREKPVPYPVKVTEKTSLFQRIRMCTGDLAILLCSIILVVSIIKRLKK